MPKFILAIMFLLCFSLIGIAQNQKDKPVGGIGTGSEVFNNLEKNQRLKIISKPRANYTKAAQDKKVEGVVTLRITFKKNGEIGKIEIVNALSDGLTEQAIAAAKGIRFVPEQKDGKSVNVTKIVTFNFNLY